MQIYGVVKKAELVRQAEWQTSLLIVTLDANGVELTFPVAKEEAAFLAVGATQGFEVLANSAEYAAQFNQPVPTEDEGSSYPAEDQAAEEYVDPADYEPAANPDEEEGILTMTDSEMKDLYGVDDGIEPGAVSLHVEGELERISAEELAQGSATPTTPAADEETPAKAQPAPTTTAAAPQAEAAPEDVDPISPLNLRPEVEEDEE